MSEQAAHTAENDIHVGVMLAMKEDDPAIEVNQVWVIRDHRGILLRGERVLGIHPDRTASTWDRGASGNEAQRKIIVETTPFSRIGRRGEISTFPEYNLRRICVLEEDEFSVWVEKEQYRRSRTCKKHGVFECTICIP